MSQEKVDRYKEQKKIVKNNETGEMQALSGLYRYRCCHCTYHRLGRLLHL